MFSVSHYEDQIRPMQTTQKGLGQSVAMVGLFVMACATCIGIIFVS